MSHDVVAPYNSDGIDAGLELDSLGIPPARLFLRYLQSVAVRRQGYRPYWSRGAYGTFRGRPVRRKDHAGCFIIYVVETERDGALRVTLILAGRSTDFSTKQAVEEVINPRLKDFFR